MNDNDSQNIPGKQDLSSSGNDTNNSQNQPLSQGSDMPIVGTENVDVPPFPQVVSSEDEKKQEESNITPIKEPVEEKVNQVKNPDIKVMGTVNDIQPKFPTQETPPPVAQVTEIKSKSIKPPKRKRSGVVVATILGLFLLVGGVAAGVILVQRQQEIRERAEEEIPSDAGPGETCGGPVSINCLSGYECIYDNSTNQPPSTDAYGICQPITAEEETVLIECLDVKAYQQIEVNAAGGGGFETRWIRLSATDLAGLSAGEKVFFTVTGRAPDPSKFTMARFLINEDPVQEVLAETNSKTKTSTDPVNEIEIYYEYEIPDDVTSFTIQGGIYHTDVGWINALEE